MDDKLKEAIEKGRQDKADRDRAEAKIAEAASVERQKYIDSKMPAARKWIEEVLFVQIAESEAAGHKFRSIYLGEGYKDGIPVEAIYQAAKKVKGLKPISERGPIYESGECVGIGDPTYSIGWESLDPNDNRNDR